MPGAARSHAHGVESYFLSADATGCYAWMHRSRIELSACAIFDVSRLSATGFGALHDSSATALGACIPLIPFLVLSGPAAIWSSLTVSMLAHFGVGAARSVFTGRGIWASGRDMFLVGFGVAAVGYIIGDLLVRF